MHGVGMGKREAVEQRRLLRAAERVRFLQVVLVPLVPVGFLVIERVMHSSRYEVTTFPTFWVPFLLIVMAATSVALAFVYRRRLRATGAADSRALYEALPTRLAPLCRHSLFVLVAVAGAICLPVSALTSDAWQSDVVDAGTATISSVFALGLLYLLAGWVVALRATGAALARRSGTSSVAGRVTALGPAGMMAFAIVASFAVAAGSVLFLTIGVVGLVVSLLATFRLGIHAGYRPPGAPHSPDRRIWIAACVLGAVAVGFRVHGLWVGR